MGVVWKIIGLMLFINIAFGLITTATTIDNDTSIFQPTNNFNESIVNYVNSTFSGNISGAPAEDKDNFGEKILDFFHLGWILKVKTFILNMLYGVPNLLFSLGFFTKKQILFIKYIMTIIYAIGLFEFIINRKLTDGGIG